MSNSRSRPEFKDEGVRQGIDHGYSVAEVSERLGVSAHSLYKWVTAIEPDKTDERLPHWSNRVKRLSAAGPRQRVGRRTDAHASDSRFLTHPMVAG